MSARWGRKGSARTDDHLATMYRLSNCKACGVHLSPEPDLSDVPYDVQDAMGAYCETCAYEILGIAIPFVGSLQHGTGGGWQVIKESKTH